MGTTINANKDFKTVIIIVAIIEEDNFAINQQNLIGMEKGRAIATAKVAVFGFKPFFSKSNSANIAFADP